jgi:hypothetical protein
MYLFSPILFKEGRGRGNILLKKERGRGIFFAG